jgi:hypothetical protein
MEVKTAPQVRFSKVIETGGQPEVYLPFSDPEKDKAFMRAAREVRVVTIRQDPTSKRKDFGIVGYVTKEKYATYLIFPKTLKAVEGQRVIGIDYDVLQSAEMRIGGKAAVPKRPGPKKAKVPKVESEPKPKQDKPKPQPKPEPQPKAFTVHVRVTITRDQVVEVRAWNATEAKANALKEVEQARDFDRDRMSAKVLKLRKH